MSLRGLIAIYSARAPSESPGGLIVIYIARAPSESPGLGAVHFSERPDRYLQCARPLGVTAPRPRPRNWLQMVTFSIDFEHLRPMAGLGQETGSKWLLSVLILSIFGHWLAWAKKLAPKGHFQY